MLTIIIKNLQRARRPFSLRLAISARDILTKEVCINTSVLYSYHSESPVKRQCDTTSERQRTDPIRVVQYHITEKVQ